MLRSTRLALVLLMTLVLPGCATLRGLAALRSVDFSLSGTSGGRLAGVPVQSVRSLDDLGPADVVRIGAALASGELPLEGDLLVTALNPESNVEARLVGLSWTLFLDDRETVSGLVDREYLLPPGQRTTVPVRVSLDLLDFFPEGLEEVAALALAVVGAGEPQRVRLEAIPSIQTPLGPMRYPEPVRIEHEVGSFP